MSGKSLEKVVSVTPTKKNLMAVRDDKSYFTFRTPFKNITTIGGKEVDLYLLYWLVTAQGGWEKVNNL